MPSIMAVPFPTRGYVYVQVDMADIPAATNVCVEAVNTVTGVRRQLHPYISYNGAGCLTLSCGQAIFYDTELPCGVAMQYCATAISASGATVTTTAAPLISDTFTRTVANGWGTADSGQAWTTSGGAAADYSTTGTRGQMAITSTNVARRTQIDGPQPNGLAQITVYPPVLASGAPYSAALMMRRDAVNNNEYGARIDFLSGGTTANLAIYRNVSGTLTTLNTVALPDAYAAGVPWSLRMQVWGSTISASAWPLASPQPAAFQNVVTDTVITAGGAYGVRSIANTGNLNTPFNMQYDDLVISDVCATTTAISVCTENVTIACDGCFRLGDPLRPCNDIQVCFCYDTTTCGGTGGTFFAGMAGDTYASNTGMMAPVNSIYPIPITRNRRAATGSFYVVPTSFVARDALLALLAPGSALLWRGPSEYGTGDRYIQVGDVPVTPVLSDLRVQPRAVELPFAVVKTPVGPSQGVCGTRFADLCSGAYQTWDAMVTGGLTYADLLRGQAGATPLNLPVWNTVNSTYASWNALNAGQTSWSDTLAGVP